jgi:hypothetical protein
VKEARDKKKQIRVVLGLLVMNGYYEGLNGRKLQLFQFYYPVIAERIRAPTRS